MRGSKMSPLVSVLTVTKRVGWENIAIESIKKQDFKDFEWIIVTEKDIDPRLNQYATVLKAPPKTRKINLSASTNYGLKHCKGTYVIFYQDFIELPEYCFSYLVALADRNTFVTTVTRNPDGVEEDPRYTWQDEVRLCDPSEWEINVGLAPMGVLHDIGGFDETYDDGWGWENCNVAERAALTGHRFLLDERNRPQLIFHKKEPDLDSTLKLNADWHEHRMQEIAEGDIPIKLSYL